MNTLFRKARLGDVCRVIPGFAFKSSDWQETGIPVVKIKNITGDCSVDMSGADCVPESILSPKLGKYLLDDGDILVAMTGATAGKVGVVRTSKRLLLNQRVAKILPVESEAKYIWAVLSSREYQKMFFNLADGAAQPNMSGGQIEGVEIPLPPLPTQKRIAGILSAYDELIENSQRRIKILETMARNLYREWFANFRFPGHEKVKMVPSPLGEIPEGWLLPLVECIDFKEGPGLRNWQYRPEGIPFLNIRTLVDNDIDLSKVQFLDPLEVEQKYRHFLLQENDHVVSSSGTIGRIVTIRTDHLPLMLNTSIIRMRPNSSRMGCWQLKHFMLSDYFQLQAKSYAIGAAQANFGPIHLKQMSVVAPTDSIADKYERFVAPIELEIMCLAQKIKNLRKTRDLLLPRLLSGQVELEAEAA